MRRSQPRREAAAQTRPAIRRTPRAATTAPFTGRRPPSDRSPPTTTASASTNSQRTSPRPSTWPTARGMSPPMARLNNADRPHRCMGRWHRPLCLQRAEVSCLGSRALSRDQTPGRRGRAGSHGDSARRPNLDATTSSTRAKRRAGDVYCGYPLALFVAGQMGA